MQTLLLNAIVLLMATGRAGGHGAVGDAAEGRY